MSVWGRLADAAAGVAEGPHVTGSIRGLLAALGGHHIFHHDRDSGTQHQVTFTIGVIALGAKMAKADAW